MLVSCHVEVKSLNKKQSILLPLRRVARIVMNLNMFQVNWQTLISFWFSFTQDRRRPGLKLRLHGPFEPQRFDLRFHMGTACF